MRQQGDGIASNVPEDDPVVTALPDERPVAMSRMSTSERARRARFFVIARGAGSSDVIAWFLSMANDDASTGCAGEAVVAMDDGAILSIARSLNEGVGDASFWRLSEPRALSRYR